MKRILLYAAAGGDVIAFHKFLEYQHLVRAYPTEIYGGIIALIFTAAGIYAGLRLKKKEIVVVQTGGPFVLNAAKLKELGSTWRSRSSKCFRSACS